jgi:hypothetical protein
MLLRAEPTKQKTRRPERSGITRAVSPKKMREEKKEMSKLRNVCEKETRTEASGSKCAPLAAELPSSLGLSTAPYG